MSELSWFLVLLGVLSICAMVFTAVFCVTARRLNRTLRRIDGLIPRCRRAVRQAQQLLARANAAARHLETAVAVASGAVGEALEPLMGLSAGLRRLLGHFHGNGNGARAEPRRHVRRHQ